MASVVSTSALDIAGLGSSRLGVSTRGRRNRRANVVVQVACSKETGLRVAGGNAALGSSYLKGSELLPALGGGGRVSMQAASAAYICKDCGYIYSDRRKPFEALSSDYSCPVCQAPKRRFTAYAERVERNANDTAVRKARKEERKKADAAVGAALPAIIGLIAVGLVGTAIYLNSQF